MRQIDIDQQIDEVLEMVPDRISLYLNEARREIIADIIRTHKKTAKAPAKQGINSGQVREITNVEVFVSTTEAIMIALDMYANMNTTNMNTKGVKNA